ncbi:MAG: LacI family transcriptional regulator, partial [Actinomycetota bacterium]|nr:LacI family transcriptional regulator [Actinomycetota bacterium]
MTVNNARRRRPSVADVARVAGVSVGTVSNVLNRPEFVSPHTRDRVHVAIEELSFVRNGRARQLRQGSSTTVGAVLLDIRNPFFTDVARGIEDRLAVDDLTLMLGSSDDDARRESKFLRLFEEHGVLGLLVVPTTHETQHLAA